MGRFFAVVNDPHCATIDTRETWAGATPCAGVLFRASRSPFLFPLSLGGTVCGYLSFIGLTSAPWVGLGTTAILPAIALSLLFSNVYLTRCLARTFTFWVVLVFDTAFLGCGMDMVRYDAVRVYALVCYWWSNVALVLFDARLFGKHRHNRYRLGTVAIFTLNAVLGIACGLLYVLGRLDIQHTVLNLPGDVQLPVSGLGMSALQAIVAYQLKCVWKLWFSRDVNPLLILYADLAYHPLADGGELDESPPSSPGSATRPRTAVQSMRVTETRMPDTLEAAHLEIADLRIQVHTLRLLSHEMATQLT